MSEFILAIDQGTTGTTCLVVEVSNAGLVQKSRASVEFPQHFPQPGWVEHDLEEIWTSCLRAIEQALAASGVPAACLAGIGIANQRETTGLWDVKGKPLHNAIVWQDRRTAEHCAALSKAGHQRVFKTRTGLVLDPYFSGTKLAWLLDHVDGLRGRAGNGDIRVGTIDTWLVWKLSGGLAHVTDVSNASRTLLCDIHSCQWDPELAAIIGNIPLSILPRIVSSNAVCGKTKDVGLLPDGIPIAGIAGDQQAALFGQACLAPGMAKCTYGTGAFALVNTGVLPVPSERGLITTVAWRLGNETTYALEGSTFVAGSVVQWLRDGLQIFSSSAEIETLAN